MPGRATGTCAKCGQVVTVDIDGLGRPWVARHRAVGRATCSGSGVPPRGYTIHKED